MYDYNKARRERRSAQKLKAIEYKGGSCHDCGGTFHEKVYDFHHVDPTDKEGSLTSMLREASWEVIQAELDKCVLLCANCHRLRHIEDDSIGK